MAANRRLHSTLGYRSPIAYAKLSPQLSGEPGQARGASSRRKRSLGAK